MMIRLVNIKKLDYALKYNVHCLLAIRPEANGDRQKTGETKGL
jgi:hypothetical protein